MKLDRMELADCATPEALVAAILKQVPDLPIPVPIDEIARQLDIRDIQYVEADGFEGGLIAFADKREGTILVNKRGNRQRRRFTTGHELGHFLNPWHKPRNADGFRCKARDLRLYGTKSTDPAVRMEVEANRFAAGILLPLLYFRRDLARMKAVDVDHVLALADRYDMSKEATARRYAEEHQEPCAAVVSCSGEFRRSYRHKAFPFIELSKGQQLPRETATASVSLEVGKTSDWIGVDADLWISSSGGRKARRVFEQVLQQQSGYRLTLLTLEDADYVEEPDEAGGDSEIDESWKIRFPRR